MKAQIKKVMVVKKSVLLLIIGCWPIFGLGAETDHSHAKPQIEALLVQARTALAQDRLTIPSGDNAVGYAQKVLNLSPGHPEAQRILQQVVGRYGLIANAALDRAEALRAREIQKAHTYHSRGERIAKQYSLSDEKLLGIDQRIAALDKESVVPLEERLITDHSQGREELKRVVARYLDKSEDALDIGGLKKARLYHDIARELVESYQLPGVGLHRLDRQIVDAERDYGMHGGRMERAKVARDPIISSRRQSVFLPPAF